MSRKVPKSDEISTGSKSNIIEKISTEIPKDEGNCKEEENCVSTRSFADEFEYLDEIRMDHVKNITLRNLEEMDKSIYTSVVTGKELLYVVLLIIEKY